MPTRVSGVLFCFLLLFPFSAESRGVFFSNGMIIHDNITVSSDFSPLNNRCNIFSVTLPETIQQAGGIAQTWIQSSSAQAGTGEKAVIPSSLPGPGDGSVTAGEKHDRYVQVKVAMTGIRDTVSPTAPVIHFATRGSHFPLINAGDGWCAISYEGTIAWIDRNDIRIVDSPSSSNIVIKDFLAIVMTILSLIVLLTIIYFVAGRKNNVKAEWFATTTRKIKIVIIAKKETLVQRLLTDTTTSLEKCFTEIGFEVKKAMDSDTAMKLISHFLPDAVVVDWQIGRNTQSVMEDMLCANASMNSMFVLYYNISAPDTIAQNRKLPNSYYLGISFSDRDLFNVITPFIITGDQKQAICKSIESSGLQGDIAECCLSEVFQFVEIGTKTGCLLIENKEPSGIIYFENGIIIYAASKFHTGEKAVFDILNMENGQFYFEYGRKPKSTNCSIDTRSVLFEWAKRTDETTRDRLRQT